MDAYLLVSYFLISYTIQGPAFKMAPLSATQLAQLGKILHRHTHRPTRPWQSLIEPLSWCSYVV